MRPSLLTPSYSLLSPYRFLPPGPSLEPLGMLMERSWGTLGTSLGDVRGSWLGCCSILASNGLLDGLLIDFKSIFGAFLVVPTPRNHAPVQTGAPFW